MEQTTDPSSDHAKDVALPKSHEAIPGHRVKNFVNSIFANPTRSQPPPFLCLDNCFMENFEASTTCETYLEWRGPKAPSEPDEGGSHANACYLLLCRICDHRHSFPEFNGDELFQRHYQICPSDSEGSNLLTSQIQKQCQFVSSVLEVERRVHAVTAAYHDGFPIVLVLLEDSALLPILSQDQLHFEVHVFLGQYQWASGFDAPSQVSFAGYLSPPSSATQLAQSTFTAGLFLQDKDHPSNRYILSVGHPFSSEFHPHVINDERKDIKIGWPDASLSLGHCDQYLKLANLRIPKLQAEMNLLHAQTLEFKGGNEHQQNLFHSRKKRYEFLAATIELMKNNILETSNRKISLEKLRITPSDTEIGHVFMACFGFVNDTSVSTSKSDSILLHQHIPPTPSSSQPHSPHQNHQFIDVSLIKITNQLLIPPPSIPQHFSSIQELRPGQKIVLDCMAVQPLRIGKIGPLESFFGLPDPVCTTSTEISDAKYFIHEHCVSKTHFAVPGASGAIVRTSAEGAATGMVVGIFEGPGIELSIILPLTRLLDIVENTAPNSRNWLASSCGVDESDMFRTEETRILDKVSEGGDIDVVVAGRSDAGASHESSTFNVQLQKFPEIKSTIVKTLEKTIYSHPTWRGLISLLNLRGNISTIYWPFPLIHMMLNGAARAGDPDPRTTLKCFKFYWVSGCKVAFLELSSRLAWSASCCECEAPALQSKLFIWPETLHEHRKLTCDLCWPSPSARVIFKQQYVAPGEFGNE
ncbi:hypothetical protein GG344DRAFT_68228 [Lentinula edodes]|nr:hypothetical protein GG344DRAFT_68228 [Lentinula edodes]